MSQFKGELSIIAIFPKIGRILRVPTGVFGQFSERMHGQSEKQSALELIIHLKTIKVQRMN